MFTEVVVAPGYDDDALATLTAKKQPARADGRSRPARRRSTCGRSTAACSCRQPDPVATDRARVVGRHRATQPTDAQWDDLAVRLAGVRRGQLERHRARQGPPGVRHRRRPAEPASTRPASPPTAAGGRAAGGVVRQRRLLPVPRRPRRRRRRRRHGRHPARRQHPRRRGRSPPPTSTASPWCSPASATSGTDRAASSGLGMTRFAESRPVA